MADLVTRLETDVRGENAMAPRILPPRSLFGGRGMEKSRPARPFRAPGSCRIECHRPDRNIPRTTGTRQELRIGITLLVSRPSIKSRM
jgi:hypothetical protein